LTRLAATVLLALAAAWGHAQAGDWGDITVISGTLGNNANRLCLGDGANRVTDIGCPTYSPYVTSGGLIGIGTTNPNANLDVYGTISATNFVGDGSGLTGVTAGATDRIVSGTNAATRMVAISDTGYISISQAGANSGWFDPYRGLVTLGVSATGPISGTAGYFSGKVVISSTSGIPLAINQGNQTNVYSLEITNMGGGSTGLYFSRIGGGFASLMSNTGNRWNSGFTNSGGYEQRVAGSSLGIADNGAFRFLTDANASGAFEGVAAFKAGGAQKLLMGLQSDNTEVFNVGYDGGAYFEGNVGIGTSAPSTSLHVSGTVRIADSGEACDGNRAGAIRYTSQSIFQICKGSGWLALQDEGSAASGDRIVSGSTSIIAHQDKSLTFTTAGAQRMIVGENGSVGIGTSNPTARLHVAGGNFALDNNQNVWWGTSGWYGIGNNAAAQELSVRANNAKIVLKAVSGNVGIGTESPTATLQVSGTLTVSTSTQDATSPSLYVGSNGRVGIGTSAPLAPLDVAGNALVYSRTGNTSFQIGQLGQYAYNELRINSSYSATSPTWQLGQGVGQNILRTLQPLAIQATDSKERMRIGTTYTDIRGSYVGINVNGVIPSSTLHVSGTLRIADGGETCDAHRAGAIRYTSQSIFQVCKGSGWLALQDEGSAASGDRIVSGSTNIIANQDKSLTFTTAGAQRMIVGENGNVGIGNSNPIYVLDVSGSARIGDGTNAYSVGLAIDAAEGAVRDLTFRTGGSPRWLMRVDHVAESGGNAGSDFYLNSRADNGASLATVLYAKRSTGNIGISTSAPLAKLDVVGTISASDAIQVGASSLVCGTGIPGAIRYNGGSLQYCNGTSWTTLGTSAGVTGTGSATAVAFWSGASGIAYSDGFYWDNGNKRLGVGTSLPQFPLHVSATQGRLALSYGRNDANAFAEYILADEASNLKWSIANNGDAYSVPETRNAFYIYQYKNQSDAVTSAVRLLINDSGNVGIGTQRPNATLQVSGSFIVSSTVTDVAPGLYVATNGLVSVGSTTTQIAGADVGLFVSRKPGRWGLVIGATDFSQSDLLFSTPANIADQRMVQLVNAANEFHLRSVLDSGMRIGRSYWSVDLSSGRMGVSNTVPQAMLDVAGTISASDAIQVGSSSLTCGSPIAGAIRYNSPNLQFCNGTSWTNISGVGGVEGDRIVSGTLAVIANSATSYVSLSTAGTTWGYFNSGMSFLPTVAANRVSATDVSITRQLSIGLPTPYSSAALHISASHTTGSYLYVTTVSTSANNGLWLGQGYPAATNWAGVGQSSDAPGALRLTGGGTFAGPNGLTIVDNGWVGIGTNAPGAILHVSGSALVGGPGSGNGYVSINAGTHANSGYTGFYTSDTTRVGYVGFGATGGALYLATDGPTRLALTTSGTERLSVLANGNVGINNTSPKAGLDVNGTVSASDAIQLGRNTIACGSQVSGSIRYSIASNTVQFCNGAGWVSLSSGTSAGVMQLASLTDVSASAPVDNQILRYNSSLSQWEAVSASDAVFSCPSGYALVSAAGRAYGCIKTTENSAAACATHINSCRAEGARLPTLSEFKMAQAQYGYTVSNYAYLENSAGDNDCAGITSAGRPYGIGDTGNYPARCFIPAVGIISSTGGGDALGDRITSGTTNITAHEDKSLTFTTAGALRMVVGEHGNVGVGTANPGDSLDVSGGLLSTGNSARLRLQRTTGPNYVDFNNTQPLHFRSIAGDDTVWAIRVTVDSAHGNVGISTTSPLAKLDVNGTISASDAIQLGQNTIACGTQVSGSIRYNTTSNTVQFCNGTGWVSLASSTMGGGASTLSVLTDVSASSPQNNQTLQYNASLSMWEAVSTSVLSSNFVCPSGFALLQSQGQTLGCIQQSTNSASTCANAQKTCFSTYGARLPFYSELIIGREYASGYSAHSGNQWQGTSDYAGGESCGTVNESSNPASASGISPGSSLVYRCFVPVAGVASGGDALGDRITSGTLAMVANSATSYVSLSTNGTTWGYLSSGNSFLPQLSTTRVSSTNVSATLLQLGQSTAACSVGNSGSIRYNSTSNTIQVCGSDGAWASLSSGTTSVGVSAIASLTDVQLSNLAGRDYLRYDAVSSKWVNISESAVMSTTTMVPGVPDALVCNVTNPALGTVVMYAKQVPYTNGNYYYQVIDSNTNHAAVYDPAGNFSVYVGITTSNCNKSFSQLYADGQAFNFIGNSGASGGSAALGDRITSGTLAMVANSATSYVSLSTNGTTWGYLNSGNSYLPQLTSARVSATNISGTLIQVGDGNGAVCDAGRKGAIRYSDTSSTVEYCNSTAWVSMGPSDTAPVSFRARKSGADQTVASSTFTKITWESEQFDTNNNFASDRFTPTVPGKYLIAGQVGCQGTITQGCTAAIYRNGSIYAQGSWTNTSGNSYSSVFAIVDMNGTGDYVELHGWNGGGTAISGTGNVTYFQGALLGPQGGRGGGGSSDLAGLSDVQLTNLAGRDYLRYDSVNGKWVNISESTVMSTTTMVSGWPDAIQCDDGSGGSFLYLDYVTAAYRHYQMAQSSGNFWVRYNTSDGTYSTHQGMGSSDCVTGTLSISQLYAAGRAFNFIGNSGGNGGSEALGDRITSGTLVMVANSATSHVSLSTNGTTWGYLNSGASFLPAIAANRISSTNISATTAHVSGKVGIGTSTPAALLTVSSTNTALGIEHTGGGNTPYISWSVNGTRQAYMGWGIPGTSFQLAMENGNALSILASDTTASGNVTAVAFLYSSDKRLKENVVPLSGGLAKLDAITPITFSFISDTTHARRLGVIAQDVEKVYPQAVIMGTDGYLKVDYSSLVPVLIDATKELKADNENLRQIVDSYRVLQKAQMTEHGQMLEQLIELKAANDNLMRRVEALEARKVLMK